MARGISLFTASFLVLCGGLVLLPSIDLWTGGIFYRAEGGFFLADWAPFRLAHSGMPYAVTAVVIAVGALFVIAAIRRTPILGTDWKAALFLLLALTLGPGLIVNSVFKDHWGRARPAQIVQFGGTQKFTPAFVPSDQCDRNCSFPAGDPAMGFYLVSVGFLVPVARRRRQVIAGALALGAFLGLTRMAQGGHFLSDVVASGFFVYATSWLLHRAIVVHDGIGVLCRTLRPSPILWRFIVLTLATAFLFALSYAFVDRPLALYFQDADPTLKKIFGVVTRFGESQFYLVPLAALVAWGWWTKRRAVTIRASLIFVAVAFPGLLADLMKPVFGRDRPQLLFRDDLYGFTWHGAHASQWSFPSGHSVTVMALSVALFAFYPALWPLYGLGALLVMASRVIIDAHYLSDVIAGAYFGTTIAWALVATARANGLMGRGNP